MVKFVQKVVVLTTGILLSACVTQNFDKDTPVVEQNASNKELAMTRVSLGLGYLKMGNTTQAKFNLEKAKKFGPDLVAVYTAFAHYYETVDEPELTIKSYEKALSIQSDDANTLNNYGVFLCRQERYEAAEKQFLKAIAIPSYLLVSESYENLASCQLKADNFDKAEQYLSKSITHSPNRGSALFQMVRLEYAMGNYKKARRYTQKFEKVTRRFKPESLALALKVYEQLGNQKTARNYGTMLVNMYPESWEAKQYVLNGLDRIEADDLAEQYREIQNKNNGNKPKKRVIVLSPNKDSSIQMAPLAKKDDEPITAPVSLAAPKQVTTYTTPDASTAVIVNPVATQSTMATPVKTKPDNSIEENYLAASENTPYTNVEPVNELTASAAQLEAEESAAIAAEVAASEAIAIAENDNELMTEVPAAKESTVPADYDDNDVNTAQSNNELVNQTLPENTETVPSTEVIESTPVIAQTDSVNPDSDFESTELTQEEPKEQAFHVVVKGDNLYGISVKYNIQIKALRRWNALDDKASIRIGDKIYIEKPVTEISSDE